MRRLLYILYILLLLSIISPITTRGQSTVISGTVTDSGGQAWINGTYTFSSNALGQVPITGSLDINGSYSVSLPHTPATSLVGDVWKISVCPAFSAGCFNANPITVVQQTQTLNLTPGAIRITVPTTPQTVTPVIAYADAEIIGGWPGFTYYNVTSSGNRQCTTVVSGLCTVWGAAITTSGNNTFTGTATFTSGGSLQGTWSGGPTYSISTVSESGNVVTVITSSPCSSITAAYQSIVISGVGVAGYNTGPTGLNGFFTLSTCSGSTFTYFNPTSGLGASSGGTVTLSPIVTQGLTHTGPETVSGQLTMTNHNNIFWAGPGPTPTIDQAISACGNLTGCVVMISPGYTGAESVSLFTNSVGYKTYTGGNNTTVEDYRANPGTPGNGFNAPIYGVVYGGRLAGQRNRLGINYYAHNETDSSAGQTSFNWVDGTLPANSGMQAAAINGLILHDTLTVGANVPILAGTDSEFHADATSSDNPIWRAFGYVGQILMSRTGATQNVQSASTYYSNPCSNISSTAVINNCYGFWSAKQTAGLNQNFSYYSQGDWATDYGTRWLAGDAGTPTFSLASSPTGATEVNQTVTFTVTGGPCTYITGDNIAVGGVTNTSYNNIYTVNSPGCNGTSTFTVYSPGTSNLAASGGGTVTRNNYRVITTFGSAGNNLIKYQPLADTSGWRWQTQAGTDIVQITNTGLFATSILGCTNNGTCDIGRGGTAPASLFLLETTAPTPSTGQDVCYADSTAHAIECNYNNGTFGVVPLLNRVQTWSAAQSFGAGQVLPTSAGTAILGTTALPIGTIQIGTAATNNFAITPSATAAARTISIPDFGANGPSTQQYPFFTDITSQYTNSTTTFSNVTGGNTIQWPVAANQTYTATCHLYYQAAATGGLNIQFTGPASPTAVHYAMDLPTALTAVASVEADAFSTSIGAVSTNGAANLDATISFVLINGVNAGTVVLQAKSSAAVQLQIQSGSFCRVQ